MLTLKNVKTELEIDRWSAKYAVSREKPSRVPKTAVVHNRERVRLVLRNILGSKTPVGNCLLAEGATPERVAGVPSAGARLRLAL